jgi:hypothetical protein
MTTPASRSAPDPATVARCSPGALRDQEPFAKRRACPSCGRSYRRAAMVPHSTSTVPCTGWRSGPRCAAEASAPLRPAP